MPNLAVENQLEIRTQLESPLADSKLRLNASPPQSTDTAVTNVWPNLTPSTAKRLPSLRR